MHHIPSIAEPILTRARRAEFARNKHTLANPNGMRAIALLYHFYDVLLIL